MPIQAVLDAFSGIPNPNWELTDSEMQEIHILLKHIKLAPYQEPMPSNLGYRGIIIKGIKDIAKIVVMHESVWIQKEDDIKLFKDPRGQIEFHLLKSTQNRISLSQYIDIINKIRKKEI